MDLEMDLNSTLFMLCFHDGGVGIHDKKYINIVSFLIKNGAAICIDSMHCYYWVNGNEISDDDNQEMLEGFLKWI